MRRLLLSRVIAILGVGVQEIGKVKATDFSKSLGFDDFLLPENSDLTQLACYHYHKITLHLHSSSKGFNAVCF